MFTQPGKSAIAALMPATMIMRMFIGMAVDFPAAMNAAWICPLLGFMIYVPFAFSVQQAEKLGAQGAFVNLRGSVPAGIGKMAALLLFLLLAYDASVFVRLTASSSNIIALNNITVHLLIVPLMGVMAASIWIGLEAVGYSARIALRILPVFVVVMLLVQLKSYRTGWLTPVLGPGSAEILQGGIYCAGNMALLTLPWMLSCEDRDRKCLMGYAAIASVSTAILLLAYQMTFPAMIHAQFTRAGRIEMILSNGRMSRSPQFVLDLLWYGGLMYLVTAEAASAAMFLNHAFSRFPKWLIVFSEVLIIGFTAVFNPHWLQNSAYTGLWYYVVAGTIVVVLLAFAWMHLFRRKICEKEA